MAARKVSSLLQQRVGSGSWCCLACSFALADLVLIQAIAGHVLASDSKPLLGLLDAVHMLQCTMIAVSAHLCISSAVSACQTALQRTDTRVDIRCCICRGGARSNRDYSAYDGGDEYYGRQPDASYYNEDGPLGDDPWGDFSPGKHHIFRLSCYFKCSITF
jgi:hypothetical protein